jgi:hypothetical protein
MPLMLIKTVPARAGADAAAKRAAARAIESFMTLFPEALTTI